MEIALGAVAFGKRSCVTRPSAWGQADGGPINGHVALISLPAKSSKDHVSRDCSADNKLPSPPRFIQKVFSYNNCLVCCSEYTHVH